MRVEDLIKNMADSSNRAERKVLGLFPYFGPDVIGGAQTSAQIAWDAVVKQAGTAATLVSYASNNGVVAGWTSPDRLIVNSKSKAVFAALTRTWDYDLIFVWHIGLLKLLPFFRLTQPRVVAMLLGIEAWRVPDRLTQNQLDKVDLYLTISDHTWQDFVRVNPRYGDKQHRTVLLGLDEPMDGLVDQPRRRRTQPATSHTTPPNRSMPASPPAAPVSAPETSAMNTATAPIPNSGGPRRRITPALPPWPR